MAKEILRMEDVTKIYDNGFVANKNVTFWLHESEILALVGENGAGKTTLMKVLFGLETPQTGKVYMDGKEVKILNTLDAIEKGTAVRSIIKGSPFRSIVLQTQLIWVSAWFTSILC